GGRPLLHRAEDGLHQLLGQRRALADPLAARDEQLAPVAACPEPPAGAVELACARLHSSSSSRTRMRSSATRSRRRSFVRKAWQPSFSATASWKASGSRNP